jgi:hypothetical protein
MNDKRATRVTPAAAHRRRHRTTALIIGLLLVCAGLTACSPGKALGELLSGMREQVDTAITNASNQGQILAVTASGQLDLAITNAESAFAEDLKKGINDLDAATQATINRLQVLVDDLASTEQAILNSAIDGSQQLINSLPFTNKNPQVRIYSPEYLGRRGSKVLIRVSGNFVYAMEQKKAVTLAVGDQTFSTAAGENITTSVAFSVPASAFPQATDSPEPITLTLTAPYEKGSLFKKIVPGTFHLLVTSLPANPIKSLTLTTPTTVTNTETASKVAPAEYATSGAGWRVESWSSCKPQDDNHAIAPDPGGWRIKTSSVKINYIHRGYEARGRAEVTTSQETGFIVHGHTDANCFRVPPLIGPVISQDSGDIHYYVTYNEERKTTTTSVDRVDLKAANPWFSWGDMLSPPVTPHVWTLKAVLWDGVTLETSASNTSNPYIHVKDTTNHIDIELITPGSLSGGLKP